MTKDKKKSPIIEFLSDINDIKQFILTDENKKDYNKFVINNFLAQHIDAVLPANMTNTRGRMSNEMHYLFLMHTLRKRRRYGGYPRTEKKPETVQLLADYYQVNRRTAETYLGLHTDEQLKSIEEVMDCGGIKGK